MKTKLFTLAILALGIFAATACNDLSSPGIDYENVSTTMSVYSSENDMHPILEVSFAGANPDNKKGLRMMVEYNIDDNPAQVLCYGNTLKGPDGKEDDGTYFLSQNPDGYVHQGSELYIGLRENYIYNTHFTIPKLPKGSHTVTMTFMTLAHENPKGDSGIGTKYTVSRTFEF